MNSNETSVTDNRTAWVIASVLLLFVFITGAGIRLGILSRLDEYHGGLIYTRESAFYYHFAKESVLHSGMQENDISAQYPDGFKVSYEHTSLKGRVTAFIYRIIRGNPQYFESFVRKFDAIYFSLGAIPVFFLMFLLSGNRWISIITSAIYISAFPVLQRSTGSEFTMENFSIPLFIGYLALFAYGVKYNRVCYSLLSGLCLALAVAGWDFIQFYLLIPASLAVFLMVFFKDWEIPAKHFICTIPFLILAGIFDPYLRSHYFLSSYGMLLSYSVAGGYFVRLIFVKKRLYFVSAVVVLFMLSIIFTVVYSGYSSTYSHVGQKFYSKIRHLNTKPVDPGKLSFTERIEWVPPFHSATEKIFGIYPFYEVLPYAVMGVVALGFFIAGLNRKKSIWLEIIVLWNIAAFIVIYLMFERAKVLLLIFLAASLCIGWKSLCGYDERIRKFLKPVWLVLIIILLFFGIAPATMTAVRGRNIYDYISISRSGMAGLKGVIHAVKMATPEDAVILADFGVCPVILAYTGRSIILHPKFESVGMRNRVEEYYNSLFGPDERNINAFANRYGAEYFVFTYYIWHIAEDSPGWVYSPKYIANAREPGYEPYGFRWLVAEEQRISFFRSLPEWTVGVPDERTKEVLPRYKIFQVVSDEDMAIAEQNHLNAIEHIKKAEELKSRDEDNFAVIEYRLAEGKLLDGIRLFPGLPADAYTKLSTVYWQLGERELWEKYATMGVTFSKEPRQ